MEKDVPHWRDCFELINENICVSANDLVADRSMSCGCKPLKAGQKTCIDNRCINFATQTECIRCSSTCMNNSFQKKRNMSVEVRLVSNKGFGLFAKESIDEGRFVAEFTGEIISLKDLQRRMEITSKEDVHTYMIELKHKAYIDCTKKGSVARFINHSCDPNCRLEVWTVGSRLRVGVFAITDIPEGTELSFDYQWEPSERPPTKCYCNALNCRGYLEIFKSDHERMIRVGCGVWVSCKDKGSNSNNSIVDEAGHLVPSKLVGKRIKFWSDDIQSYMEAKVVNHEEGDRYNAYCIIEKTHDTVSLRIEDNRWYWFDDHRSVISIRKKQDREDIDSMLSSDDEMDRPDDATPRTVVHNIEEADKKVMKKSMKRCEVKVPIKAAGDLLGYNESWLSAMNGSDLQRLQASFIKEIRSRFEVFATIVDRDSKSSSFNSGEQLKDFVVEACGEKEGLDKLRAFVAEVSASLAAASELKRLQAIDSLKRRQELIVTRDWRWFHWLDASSGDLKSSYGLPDSLIFSILNMPSNFSSGLMNVNELEMWCRERKGALLSISRSLEIELLSHLRTIVMKMNLSRAASIHAMVILLRYICFVGDAVLRDMTIVLAAVVSLASKLLGLFKFRSFSKLVRVAYCTVFSREEDSVGDSTDSYISRVCDKERDIRENLCYDLFVPSVLPILQVAEFGPGIAELWSTLLEDTSLLVETLYVLYSKVTVALSLPLLEAAVLLLLIGFQGSDGHNLALDPICSFVRHMLIEKCRFTAPLMRWIVDFMCKILADSSSALMGHIGSSSPRIAALLEQQSDPWTLVQSTLARLIFRYWKGEPEDESYPCPLRTRVHPKLLAEGTFSKLEVSTSSIAKIQRDVLVASISPECRELLLPSASVHTAALRVIPPSKLASKELKKFQGYNVTASAVLPSEVAELALLQYLQYFSSPRDSASCICGSKYVVCPLIYAMVRNSSGDVARATSSPHLSDSDDDSPAGQQHDLSEYCSRSLFAFPSFKLPLSAVLDSGIKVTSELSLQWAWQLLLVADYLISRGVGLRWIDPQHVFISHDGDLVVGSVSGAEYFTRIATEQSKRSTHAGKDKTDEEIPKVIPTHILNLSAPEIILGAQTSPRSTIFSIGALICWIASGKPFVKSANDEKRQIDYFFRVLGTPKAMEYRDFHALPHSSKCVAQIKKDDGSWTEGRSRLSKVLEGLLEGHSHSKEISQLIQNCCSLVPQARQSPSKSLRESLFAASQGNSLSAFISDGAISLPAIKREIVHQSLNSAIEQLRAGKSSRRIAWNKLDIMWRDDDRSRKDLDNCSSSCDLPAATSRIHARSTSPLQPGFNKRARN